MDWADDITFSVHDLIDFYCAGQIPLDRLSPEGENSEERAAFFDEVFERNEELCGRRAGLEEAFRDLVAFFPLNRRYVGSRDQRERLWQFSTLLISRFVDAISLAEPTPQGRACIRIRTDAMDEVRMLKELTWHYVILHNDLALDQRGQRQMIKSVFDELHDAAHKSNHLHLFPPFFRTELHGAVTPQHKTRIVCDYVSSMTEQEVTRIHRALTGRA